MTYTNLVGTKFTYADSNDMIYILTSFYATMKYIINMCVGITHVITSATNKQDYILFHVIQPIIAPML